MFSFASHQSSVNICWCHQPIATAAAHSAQKYMRRLFSAQCQVWQANKEEEEELEEEAEKKKFCLPIKMKFSFDMQI